MKYYFDGYTLYGNPSKFGGGFTVFDSEKLINTEQIIKSGMTNNEAELMGIEWILNNCPDAQEIFTDSMNTIYWIRNGKSKARPDLNDRLEKCWEKVLLGKIKLKWIPRDKNLAGWYNETYI